MEENEEEVLVTDNLTCGVCGERQFQRRHGYFFCQECGTRQQQMRDVEVEREADPKNVATVRIHSLKAEKPKLTSWELYNYVLRGLVEELLSLGAKEELKLMTLQLWAAYLRKTEAAFFNKKHAELPRLGVGFKKVDADALYNHAQKKLKLRKRRRSQASSSGDEFSYREYNKSKRQLDESVYSELSANDGSDTLSSFPSSPSESSSIRALQLKFSSRARGYYKTTMPAKHLDKHAADSQGLLKCHTFKAQRKTIKRPDYAMNLLSMRQLYSILALSLNLIEDDIQLSDFARYTTEEHIGTKNVLQYFPEDLAPNVKTMLQDINFYAFSDKITDKALRENILYLSKFLKVMSFKQPDLKKLASRYITELQLPSELSTYVERLINFLPPTMKTRMHYHYPQYEARAMAYVIFVLKLLFGLDDNKEQVMSKSAELLNMHIESRTRNTGEPKQAKLFVWQQWQQYVEMRKIILSQHNSIFCHQYEQGQNMNTLLNELNEQQRLEQDEEKRLKNHHNAYDTRVMNMQRIFEMLQNRRTSDEEAVAAAAEEVVSRTVHTTPLILTPSLTPAYDNFKRLHNATDEMLHSQMPDFMLEDHTVRTLQPLMKAKSLCNYFEKVHKCSLQVLRLPCTSARRFVGYFRATAEERIGGKEHLNTQKADFNIDEHDWLDGIEKEAAREILEFKTVYEKYTSRHIYNLTKKLRSTAGHDEATDIESVPQSNDDDISIQLFDESDMNPTTNVNLSAPRRQLGRVRLFDELSSSDEDDENDINDADVREVYAHLLVKEEVQQPSDDNGNDLSQLTFISSKMDLWILLGLTHILTEPQRKQLQGKFPHSFFWLLQTCAQMLGIDWHLLYEQLLAIEVMFTFGLDKMEHFKDCLYLRYDNPIKDINMLTKSYRDIW